MRSTTRRSVRVSTQWTENRENNRQHSVEYKYRVICNDHFYGNGCQLLCAARDDKFGHFRCSANGTRLCLPGFSGDYCDKRMSIFCCWLSIYGGRYYIFSCFSHSCLSARLSQRSRLLWRAEWMQVSCLFLHQWGFHTHTYVHGLK